MLIVVIIVLIVLVAAGAIAYHATPGAPTRRTLIAGLTAAAVILLAIMFFAEFMYLLIIAAVTAAALACATGRLTFWRAAAAGLGSVVILYLGILLARSLHGLVFGDASAELPSSIEIESVRAAQIFGIDLGLLIAGLGAAMLAAVTVASADARPWLAFIGAGMLLGGGAVELHHHWDAISGHVDFSDPRTWTWVLIAKAAVVVVFASLLKHGRGSS